MAITKKEIADALGTDTATLDRLVGVKSKLQILLDDKNSEIKKTVVSLDEYIAQQNDAIAALRAEAAELQKQIDAQ